MLVAIIFIRTLTIMITAVDVIIIFIAINTASSAHSCSQQLGQPPSLCLTNWELLVPRSPPPACPVLLPTVCSRLLF